MEIEQLRQDGRAIWGDEKLGLEEIIVRLGVIMGDINRHARDGQEGKQPDETELKKELGNLLFSLIRWCDDLGYSPEECIELARQAQRTYSQALLDR